MGNCLKNENKKTDSAQLSWNIVQCTNQVELMRTELHFNNQVLLAELKKASRKPNNRFSVHEIK